MSIYVASKIFISTVVLASLLDMLVAQALKSSRFYDLIIVRKVQGSVYWNLLRYVGGDRAVDFIASRTILFPIAEIVFGASVVLSIYSVGFDLLLLPKLLFAVFFVLLLVVPLSLEYTMTPHAITTSGTVLGILSGLVNGIPGLISSLEGALVGFGLLGFLYMIGKLYARLIRREGETMGSGSITAMAMTGAFCGFPGVVNAIFIALISAGLVATIYLGYLVARRRYQPLTTELPYSPFMVLGGAIVIYVLPLFSTSTL